MMYEDRLCELDTIEFFSMVRLPTIFLVISMSEEQEQTFKTWFMYSQKHAMGH